MFVVIDVLSIASENVTVMLSVIDTALWLSAVVETEVTVGAVMSEDEELSEEPFEFEVVLSVLEELSVILSSDFAHEEVNTVMLTIRTNQDKILFILSLNRIFYKSKTKNLYITWIGLIYKNEIITWMVSDCEELVGVTYRIIFDWTWEDYCLIHFPFTYFL